MNTQPKTTRPNTKDTELRQQVAAEIAPQLTSWSRQNKESTAANLAEVLQYATEPFQIGKRLERSHDWDVDMELLEMLDGLWGRIQQLNTERMKTWVKASGLTPPTINGEYTTQMHNRTIKGTVLENYEEGTSVLHCPEEGHVKEGPGTRGWIIHWENLTAV